MIKALKNEHHQGPRVNNPSFRFSCNIDEQEKRVLECEQYLIKVESSSGTCKISQVKKKIAGRFSSEISHSILTTAQFIESSSRELLTILLPENIALSDMQREILMREVCSVYGNNNCYLDRVKTELKISEAVVGKEEENMEEAQSASTSEPHFINPRSTPLSSLKQDSVWRQVRQALLLQYGNNIDEAWFSKAVAKECTETSLLTLTMPTRFMADWLKNHYGYAISRISGTFSFKYIEYNY
ncbi:DnaA N-terminal domain-containing protein [Rickettsia australis]|nr:DnaA N-terminal domain-containing protein [Rickettsia australis]